MRNVIATLTVLAVATAGAAAPPADWQPVDQAVGDLDPLTSSMRVIQPGLRTIGEQTSLFRVETDAVTGLTLNKTSYVRVGTGFRARYDRPDYLVIVDRRHFDRNIAPRFDGEFVELVPPNTVYDLTPLPSVTTTPAVSKFAAVGPRIDPRIDGRIYTGVSGRVYAGDGRIRPSLRPMLNRRNPVATEDAVTGPIIVRRHRRGATSDRIEPVPAEEAPSRSESK